MPTGKQWLPVLESKKAVVGIILIQGLVSDRKQKCIAAVSKLCREGMMNRAIPTIDSAITFFYYRELSKAAVFYEHTLGLELIIDENWAKIYRIGANGFMGIVNEREGFHDVQEKNAVVLTLVVNDVDTWYRTLKQLGVKLLGSVQQKDDIQVRCFFAEDPGGYTLEIQQFLRPDMAKYFGRVAASEDQQ